MFNIFVLIFLKISPYICNLQSIVLKCSKIDLKSGIEYCDKLSFNCQYSKTIMNKIEKYKPINNIYYESNNN